MKNSTYFDILNINTLQRLSPIEVSSCYIRMNIGLFTPKIYANWVRKEELERWV
jgi:hypothetical protein